MELIAVVAFSHFDTVIEMWQNQIKRMYCAINEKKIKEREIKQLQKKNNTSKVRRSNLKREKMLASCEIGYVEREVKEIEIFEIKVANEYDILVCFFAASSSLLCTVLLMSLKFTYITII